MHRLQYGIILAASWFLATGTALGQDTSSSATASCNFDSTKQVAVEYQRIAFDTKKEVLGGEIPYGEAWTPGRKAMTLFTNTAVTVGDKDVPVGAYTMFVIPEKKAWTLIISKSTDTSGKYDEQQDLARIAMQFGKLPHPEAEFSVYFVHAAPGQCNMRLYLHNAGAWVSFKLKQ